MLLKNSSFMLKLVAFEETNQYLPITFFFDNSDRVLHTAVRQKVKSRNHGSHVCFEQLPSQHY
jgi:hypothetical protein